MQFLIFRRHKIKRIPTETRGGINTLKMFDWFSVYIRVNVTRYI